MDPQVLRAAVSAAIRVTVSTTLIGCGGSVADGSNTATNGAAGRSAQSETNGSGGHRAAPVPASTSGGGTSAAGASAVTGGTGGASTATGGAAGGTAGVLSTAGAPAEPETGGGTNAAGGGQAGEAAAAGAPAEVCGGAVLRSMRLKALELPTDALRGVANACCQTVILGFDELRADSAPCYDDLELRFRVSGVRQMCCADKATWEHLACTPWGPPVPPELPAAMQRAWSLVA